MKFHPVEDSYQCAVCCEWFISRNNKEWQMKSQAGDIPYLCALCNQELISQPNLERGGLNPVVSHKSVFGNQEIWQLELWNLAQWEVSLVVQGKVLWRKCIGGLGVKINHICEITRGPPPLDFTHQCLLSKWIYWFPAQVLAHESI